MLWTLDSSGEATSWITLDDIAAPFVITGKFTGTPVIGLEISNDPSSAKADANVVESYNASFAKVVNKPFPRRFRLKLTSWVGGQSVVVGVGKGFDSQGNYIDLHLEGSTNSPTGDF